MRNKKSLNVENPIAAGHCIFTIHEAFSSSRMMATCMAMEEAAGWAAKNPVLHGMGIDLGKLNASDLQEGTFSIGGYLNIITK